MKATVRSRLNALFSFIILLSLLFPFSAQANNGPVVGSLPAAPSVSTATQEVVSCPGDVGVNTWNGNLFVPRTDLYVPGRGMTLELLMMYNSQLKSQQLGYGYGWRMVYHIAYHLDSSSGEFIVTWGEGHSTPFPTIDGQPGQSSSSPELSAVRYEGNKYRVRSHDGTTFYFEDAAHKRITGMEDAFGNALIFTYDGSQRLTEIANAAGGSLTLSYSGARLAQVMDSAGRSVQYTYDANGDMVTFQDAMGVDTTYAYSGTTHLLNGTTDAKGNPVTISYGTPDDIDDAYFVTSVQSALVERRFEYDPNTLETSITDVDGGHLYTTFHYYFSDGNIWRIQNPRGWTEVFYWDYNNNLVLYEDFEGQKTYYNYDERGNLIKMTDDLDQVTTYTWDPVFNTLTSVTDPLSRTVRYSYDHLGNLIGIVDPLGNMTHFAYDAYGQMVEMTDARGQSTQYQYDAQGNTVQITNPLGQSGRYEYDAMGNVTAVVAPDGARTTFTYNAAGQNLVTSNPLGYTRVVTYDDLGLVTAVQDEAGRVTIYDYDSEGRVTGVTDAAGGGTAFAYDARDNVTAWTNALGKAYHAQYDLNGRLLNETDALGQPTGYEYDANGTLTYKIMPDNQETHLYYDDLGRLERVTYEQEGTSEYYAYDAVGNVVAITDTLSDVTLYTYDANNRLIEVEDTALNTTIQYSYDPNGNRRSMTDPDGGITYAFYDELDRLERLVNSFGETTLWAYDGRGQVSQITYPNKTWAELDYDLVGRLTGIAHYYSDGSTLARYQYTYDAVGNRVTVSEENYGTTTYTYDVLDQLTNASGPGGTTAYGYDPVGNRTLMIDGSGTTNYVYNAANQLTQSTGPGGTTDYEYDVNGNLIRRTAGTDVTGYVYDARDNMTQINLPDGSSQSFTYGYSGLRRSVTEGGTTTSYVYDPLTENVIMERQGGTMTRYTTGLGLDMRISQRRSGESTFYHMDGLGSVIALSDDAQDVVATYRYDPYGQITNETSSVTNPYLYAGRRWNATAGLYDMRMRDYDPTTGRFTTPDPVAAPTLPNLRTHPYVYAGNNPVNRVDPRGTAWNLWAWVETGINAVSAGYDAWRNGGSFTDIVQAAGVSGVVDAINAMLGGVIPNALRDPVKNLLNQIIDWARGKRCGINWKEVLRAGGMGLIKDILGALYKMGAIGKGKMTSLINELHGGAQGVMMDVAAPEVAPVGPGPCHKRRRRKPVRRRIPRRTPRQIPTITGGGDTGGRYTGGVTGTGEVAITPERIPSGTGQTIMHTTKIHNTSNEDKMTNVQIRFPGMAMDFTFSLPSGITMGNVHTYTYPCSTYVYIDFTAVPSTTYEIGTTGVVSPETTLKTGGVVQPETTITFEGGGILRSTGIIGVGDGGGGPAPGLTIHKSDSPDPVSAGGEQTYHLRVENTGETVLGNVFITETYPLEVTFLSSAPAPYSGNDQWMWSSLAPNESQEVTITVRVDNDLTHGTVLTNTAGAYSSQTPLTTTVETAMVRHHPPLVASKTATPWPPKPGQPVTYTLFYENQGQVPIENLIAVESFDPRYIFVSASTTPDGGQNHIWSLGTLAAGASKQLQVVMDVPTTLPYTSELCNEAVFWGDNVDPVLTALKGTELTVDAGVPGELVDETETMTTTIQVPGDAVTQETTLLYTPLPEPVQGSPSGFSFAGHAFSLDAYQNGTLHDDFVFQNPITVKLAYDEANLGEIDEDGLLLLYWDDGAGEWMDVSTTCSPASTYTRQLDQDWLSVDICHLSEFALFGKGDTVIYLPIVFKNSP